MEIHLTVPDTQELRQALLTPETMNASATHRMGVSEEIAPDVEVHVLPSVELAEIGLAGPVITASVFWVKSVTASVIGAWLYDKLKSAKGRTIEIDHREIHLNDEGQIVRIIEDHVRKDDSSPRP